MRKGEMKGIGSFQKDTASLPFPLPDQREKEERKDNLRRRVYEKTEGKG